MTSRPREAAIVSGTRDPCCVWGSPSASRRPPRGAAPPRSHELLPLYLAPCRGREEAPGPSTNSNEPLINTDLHRARPPRRSRFMEIQPRASTGREGCSVAAGSSRRDAPSAGGQRGRETVSLSGLNQTAHRDRGGSSCREPWNPGAPGPSGAGEGPGHPEVSAHSAAAGTFSSDSSVSGRLGAAPTSPTWLN